ncbi:MAG: peptidylprolyl isomerase [Methanothrix sp.]|nr:peptidylprolyl isomerase [Methanothrix sp.]
MAQAKPGDRVRVHYTGTLEDGTVFSSTSEEKEPFEFTIGGANILPSFQIAIIGMKVGETKSISVLPEDAYGQHRKEFVFEMAKTQAPGDLELALGKRLQVRTRDGKAMIATVRAITEESVILDANDPLAGRTLKFAIELMEVL